MCDCDTPRGGAAFLLRPEDRGLHAARAMNTDNDQLNILAPRAIKPKFDYLHREVQRAVGRPLTRRQALGLGGMALFAAACGSTSTTGGGGSAKSSSASATPLAGKPLENHLEIYNWSQYDDPS